MKNVIAGLLQEYDIKSVDDIYEVLKDLLGETIQDMLEDEMDEQLGYEPHARSDSTNARNGYKTKTLKSEPSPKK